MIAVFATTTDMEQRSQGAITATSHPFLERELEAATAAIRRYCGWHIAPVEPVTYRHTRPWREQVWLPAMEIGSIDSVTVDGETRSAGEVRFDRDIGWTDLHGCTVEVSFTAGFATVPADLVALTLEVAASALGSPLNIAREQAGGVSVTFGRVGGGLQVGPGGADVSRLAPYKLGRLP